jgi:hypothetical protein
LNHTEFINKLEELSHVVQGTPVSAWDLFSAQVTAYTTMIFAALVLGFLTAVPLIAMHSAVTDEIKDSGANSNAPLWFLSMSIALVISILVGVVAWCLGQQFVSSSANHVRELQQQYDLHQHASTDLYNQLMDMSDDDFEKLATAKSSYKLTKEQEVKYKDVTKIINKVAKNKKKLHE